MPPRPRRLTREESKARTRAELLRAARRLFVRNGFVATSLSDIAEEAALTKGAVYSNFESKEELFLAVLQERADEARVAGHDQLSPSDVSAATGSTPEERAAAWGRALAAHPPDRRNVALFLEMNAYALRSGPARPWVAEHNREFFHALGDRLRHVLGAPDADAATLGLVAQSLYVGLMMHAAFDGTTDEETYAAAYRMLAALAAEVPSR